MVRFPEVPPNPFWSADEEAARRALSAVTAFVDALARELDGALADLAPPMRAVLAALVGVSPPDPLAKLARYRLAPFPRHSVEGQSATERLAAVLMWRAGIVDFLSDVWDTLGDAGFSLEDCRVVEGLFTPPGIEPASTCPYCLGPQSPTHYAACPVQRAWAGGAGDGAA